MSTTNEALVPMVRRVLVVSLLGVLLAGATGCASMGGTTTVSSRATRFSAYPVDDQILQREGSAPRVLEARGYSKYVGG